MRNTSKATEGRKRAMEKAGPNAMSKKARKERYEYIRGLVLAAPQITRIAAIKMCKEKFGISLSGSLLDKAFKRSENSRAKHGVGRAVISRSTPATKTLDEKISTVVALLREEVPELWRLALVFNEDGTYTADYGMRVTTEVSRKIRG